MSTKTMVLRRSLLLSACLTLTPIGCDSSPPVIESNYDKIKSGMTEREVTAILGQPFRVDEEIARMRWRFAPTPDNPDIRGEITVSFDHGKVQDKRLVVIGPKPDGTEHGSGRFLVFDRVALEDFPRRLTALHTLPTVAIVAGSAGLLIVGVLIRRYRSRRSSSTVVPPENSIRGNVEDK